MRHHRAVSLQLSVEATDSSTTYAVGDEIGVRVVLTNGGDETVQVSEMWRLHLTLSFYPLGQSEPLPLGPPGIPPAGGFPTGSKPLAPGASFEQDYRDIAFMLANKPLPAGQYRIEAEYAQPARLGRGSLRAVAEPVTISVT
jgi:hypothetical protein